MIIVILEQSEDSRWIDPIIVDTEKMEQRDYAKKLEAAKEGESVQITFDEEFAHSKVAIVTERPVKIEKVISVWVSDGF